MELGGCVYITTNLNKSVLYTGVTSDLYSRIYDHKNKKYPGSFTARYSCDMLVYYNSYPTIQEAIAAEKLIKGGSRRKKVALINSINPEWKDLSDEIRQW